MEFGPRHPHPFPLTTSPDRLPCGAAVRRPGLLSPPDHFPRPRRATTGPPPGTPPPWPISPSSLWWVDLRPRAPQPGQAVAHPRAGSRPCTRAAARRSDTARDGLPHAVCLTTGHPDSVDASRILNRLSPQTHGAFGATTRFRAAIVALRTCTDSVEAPHLTTECSRLFPHWCKGCFDSVG